MDGEGREEGENAEISDEVRLRQISSMSVSTSLSTGVLSNMVGDLGE